MASDQIFYKIESYIKSADNFLSKYPKDNDLEVIELKDFFARTIIMVIVSEYEAYIESAFVRRVELCGDGEVINLGKRSYARTFRSPDLSKINTELSVLNDGLKEQFINTVNTDGINVAWDNIMKARHAIVHKQGSLQLSFEDVKQEFIKTKKVIEVLENVLFPRKVS